LQLFNPLALGFAVIIPLIILLYLLKPRRQEMMVPSTYLWEQVQKDIEASNPWQRLKKNLLLLLQLLVAALLVMALTRPYLPVAQDSARHLVVVLDCSASMAASDVSPSRFDEARRVAGKMADQLGPGDCMTLITMEEKPGILVSASRDRKEIKRLLDELRPNSGSADLEPVLAIVSAMLKNDNNISLLVLTDGGVKPLENQIKLSCPVKVELMGKSSDNLAITTLATRHQGSRVLTLARVQNFSNRNIESDIELRAQGSLIDVRSLVMKPGEVRDIIWEELPPGVEVIEARLSVQDIYSRDNQVWAVVQAADKNRALLISRGNIFMEKALNLCPALDLYRTSPENYLQQNEHYDLYVFDGWLPQQLPRASIIVLNPPASNPFFAVNDTSKNIASITASPDEPLLRYVDVNGWQMASASNVNLPVGCKSLLQYEQKPLLVAGDYQGQRVALFSFDLHNSNIPLQTGFPILINNLATWLLPERLDNAGVISGDEFRFTPLANSREIIVQNPDGKEESFKTPFPPAFSIINPGPYRFTQVSDDREHSFYVVKNSGNLLESNLKPQNLSWIQTKQKPVKNISNREFWPFLAVICLFLLLLEWEVYRRGY
jgi:Ca-activated chloride channel family protein